MTRVSDNALPLWKSRHFEQRSSPFDGGIVPAPRRFARGVDALSRQFKAVSRVEIHRRRPAAEHAKKVIGSEKNTEFYPSLMIVDMILRVTLSTVLITRLIGLTQQTELTQTTHT